jgi:hypothetical protein
MHDEENPSPKKKPSPKLKPILQRGAVTLTQKKSKLNFNKDFKQNPKKIDNASIQILQKKSFLEMCLGDMVDSDENCAEEESDSSEDEAEKYQKQ